jgi:hypothetical protein
MDVSFPLDEWSLKPLFGQAVCVITMDDARHTGILTSCGATTLVLNGERTARPVKRSRKSKRIAEISSAEQETSGCEEPTYWGNMSLVPPMKPSAANSVFSLSQVKAVLPL